MNEVVVIHVRFGRKTHLVGHLRYLGKAHRPSSLFEHTDSRPSHGEALALDPANYNSSQSNVIGLRKKLHYRVRSETVHLTTGDGNPFVVHFK